MALTPQQSRELRGLIEERRRVLLGELREDVARWRREEFGEIAGPAPDAGDESVAALIAELDRAEVSRDVDELRGLEAAAERLEKGGCGECVDCGGDIGFERLRAAPQAIRCVDCQRLYEKTFVGGPAGSKL